MTGFSGRCRSVLLNKLGDGIEQPLLAGVVKVLLLKKRLYTACEFRTVEKAAKNDEFDIVRH
jgi:hypothetical protein